MTVSLPRFQCDITASSKISTVPDVRAIVIEDGALIVRLYAPGASHESVAAVGRVLQALVEEIKSNAD
jgi:hypothetical protein